VSKLHQLIVTETPVFQQPVLTQPRSHWRDQVASIFATLAATNRFQTFTALLVGTRLSEGLRAPGGGSVTLFAPSDYAFERLPREVMHGLLADPDRLRTVLEVHLTDGLFYERDLIPFTRLQSRAGVSLHLAITEKGETLVNGIPVLTADILATNGVIHELDGVLLAD
jgi:uncharacterized surface protein with fasciclin (FAS1) repeats